MCPKLVLKRKRVSYKMEEEEIKKQEEILEYLSRTITGKKKVNLQIVDIPCSYADVEKDEVFIQETDGIAETDNERKRFWKAYDLHESAHISWSGTLIDEYKKWKAHNGEFTEFKDTVNVVEDIRIEEGLCKVFPQARKYFEEFLDKFVEKRGEDGILDVKNNLNMALRLALETKRELKYKIDKEAEPYIKEAVKKFHEFNVVDGNWETAVECSQEIHKIFERARKKHPDEFASPVAKKNIEVIMIAEDMEGGDTEFKELKAQDKALSEKMRELTEEGKGLIKDKEDGKMSDEEFKKKSEELGKKADELMKEKEAIKKKMEKNAEKHRELAKKYREIREGLEKERREASSKKELGEGFVRIIHFERRKEKGELADLKTDELVVELEDRHIELDEDTEPSGATFEYDDMPRFEKLPTPEVERFDPTDKFDGEYKIPELEKAIETGDEIASALKRALKLKKSLIKRKTSGKIDMRRVRKQFVTYGAIRDTDIFARSRKMLPEHSVMVMVDMSGSMAGTKIITAKQAFAVLARTLGQLRVPYSLRGYSAQDHKLVIADIVIKDFDKEECNYEDIDKVYYPISKGWWGQNRDGDSWRHGAGILNNQKGDKLLIVICDGMPHHGGTNYLGYPAYEDCKLAVEQIEMMGIKTIGISIDRAANDYINETFKNSFFFDGTKLDSFATGLTEVYLNAMKF